MKLFNPCVPVLVTLANIVNAVKIDFSNFDSQKHCNANIPPNGWCGLQFRSEWSRSPLSDRRLKLVVYDDACNKLENYTEDFNETTLVPVKELPEEIILKVDKDEEGISMRYGPWQDEVNGTKMACERGTFPVFLMALNYLTCWHSFPCQDGQYEFH